MRILVSFTFLLFSVVLLSQSQEVTLSRGANQQSFKDAITNPSVGTISIKTSIRIVNSISVPSSKILKFYNGNKLIVTSGSLKMEKCVIEAGKYQIFEGSNISGSFKNEVVYPEWFGAKVNDKVDDAFAIQKAIDFTEKEVFLSQGKYWLTKELSKTQVDGEPSSEIGVHLVGSGQKGTFISVNHSLNFIKFKGGDSSRKRIQGIVIKDLTVDGLKRAENGISLYSCRHTEIENVHLKNFKNSAIVFEGNPNLNPDYSASEFTKILNSSLIGNSIGVLNKLDNNAPLLLMEGTIILQNSIAGVVWNSSYFTSVNSSISFNGDPSVEGALGGFYNNSLRYYPKEVPTEYYAKGIVLESTEFDANYPSSITLKTSKGARVIGNSIQLRDNIRNINKFTSRGAICIGGDEKILRGKVLFERSRNTLIQNNSIKYLRYNESTFIEPNTCLIKVSPGALFTQIDNNCFHTNKPKNLGETHYFIKEYESMGETRGFYNKKEAYLRLSNIQCISPDVLYDAVDLVYPSLTKRRLRN